ncbi:Rieske (2Fe-2S) protein [Planomonospora venezuelensis]|uniref:Cytochrome bc1 complex Rieske iron-sulfur subunit n=1 Tax=Planomonospora venezuelensis TaxID=1999 RepID=A0A841D559_PLAVE|nr:Rieske (2Fe-2S) protein [Planomonospora venezuelensis]MBB5963488.1 nitrite reductase/ring-hydroxylating ferredoxin subunit [Planomonospora venezuelensis]GIM62765.1 Rieske iron-sulfur protein [Planomonospora venezuelensis]
MTSSDGSAMPTRRHVIGAAGAVACGAALAGCATAAGERTAGPPPAVKGKVVAQTADIPVGGGKVIHKWKIVITQPSAGVFKAFNASCPHKGCAVSNPSEGVIRCPCHGSEFDAVSGKCLKGPAEAPLVEFALRVEGGGIVMV